MRQKITIIIFSLIFTSLTKSFAKDLGNYERNFGCSIVYTSKGLQLNCIDKFGTIYSLKFGGSYQPYQDFLNDGIKLSCRIAYRNEPLKKIDTYLRMDEAILDQSFSLEDENEVLQFKASGNNVTSFCTFLTRANREISFKIPDHKTSGHSQAITLDIEIFSPNNLSDRQIQKAPSPCSCSTYKNNDRFRVCNIGHDREKLIYFNLEQHMPEFIQRWIPEILLEGANALLSEHIDIDDDKFNKNLIRFLLYGKSAVDSPDIFIQRLVTLLQRDLQYVNDFYTYANSEILYKILFEEEFAKLLDDHLNDTEVMHELTTLANNPVRLFGMELAKSDRVKPYEYIRSREEFPKMMDIMNMWGLQVHEYTESQLAVYGKVWFLAVVTHTIEPEQIVYIEQDADRMSFIANLNQIESVGRDIAKHLSSLNEVREFMQIYWSYKDVYHTNYTDEASFNRINEFESDIRTFLVSSSIPADKAIELAQKLFDSHDRSRIHMSQRDYSMARFLFESDQTILAVVGKSHRYGIEKNLVNFCHQRAERE